MADEDDDQKTEDPSPRRIQSAREEGNLPISRELATWMLLLGIVIVVTAMVPYFIGSILAPLTAIFANAGEMRIGEETLRPILAHFIGSVSIPILAITCTIATIAITGWVMQTGFYMNISLFKLHWEKLNPVAGVGKLFSLNSLVELLKSMGKIILIGYVGYALMEPLFFKAQAMTGLDNLGMVHVTYGLVCNVLFTVFLVFSVIVILDIAYQRYTYFKNLRMTKQEVKEEYRQSEGDPHIKAKLRQIRQEKARKRIATVVPQADVVITNPTHFAVALKYEAKEMQAPVVLAKGQDFLAQKIRELAETHKIPMVSNPPLARALYTSVEEDQMIPPEHYRAVAEVISYVYRLKGKRKKI